MASTTFTSYLPLRAVSGIFTTSLSNSAAKMDWRPDANVPIGFVDGKPVNVNPHWFRHLRAIGTQKLGGRNFATLPDVADQVTRSQVTDLVTAAQDQMATANAQTLAAILEILVNNGLTTTADVPAPVLARQETNPPPTIDFGETGGGAGE